MWSRPFFQHKRHLPHQAAMDVFLNHLFPNSNDAKDLPVTSFTPNILQNVLRDPELVDFLAKKVCDN